MPKKEKQGVVVSNKTDKTIVVAVKEYAKIILPIEGINVKGENFEKNYRNVNLNNTNDSYICNRHKYL